MATREQWQAACRAWIDSWDLISTRVSPCGHPDARHRVADAWDERYAAGDSIEDIAADHGKDPADVQAVVLLGLAADQLRAAAGLTEEEVLHQLPP